MKINKITNAQEFFKVVDDCKGRVELLTGEGDRLNMKSKLCQFMSMTQLFSSLITIISVLAAMLIINVPLTVVTLVMVGVTLIVTKKVAGLSGAYFIQQQRDLGKVNGHIEEMMNGQKVVKVFCHEDESIERFDQLNNLSLIHI